MDYETLSRDLNAKMNGRDRAWGSLDIWPKNSREGFSPAHVFLSAVLSVIGDAPVERVSWSAEDSGALVATVWTEGLVVQSSRGSKDDQLVTSALPRKSLVALRVITSPALSISNWGHYDDYVAELVYPDLTATFRTRDEEDFLAALAGFSADLI